MPRDAAGPGCATVLLLIAPFVIAWNVMTIATGTYQVGAMRPAGRVLLVWLIAAVATIVAVWTIRGRGLRSPSGGVTLSLTIVLTVVAFAVTGSETENDAPDGSDFEVTLGEAEAAILQEATNALDVVAGQGWTDQNEASFSRRSDTCIDAFGRNRGAFTSSRYWVVDRLLSASEIETLMTLLERPDRRVLNDLPGDPPWDSSRDFVYRIDEANGMTRLQANLPCLAPR